MGEKATIPFTLYFTDIPLLMTEIWLVVIREKFFFMETLLLNTLIGILMYKIKK
ncbi:hypothetical protein MNBD_PLANCTO02-751 [hydrothermal vent metagenome]|uniref:Uncharacterized protein n=1 Tax=hydrothermal vent metagenome TaxID=652676 RepID=A0A3B1DS04_9ZZZZ